LTRDNRTRSVWSIMRLVPKEELWGVPPMGKKTYSGLVALHMPRPIHDTVAYDNAVEIVHALAGHKLNDDQDDYLTLMAKLVEDYEGENVAEPKPVKGIEALKFLLEENKLTADDLGEIIGVNRSLAYRILKSPSEKSDGSCLPKKGWMARRDEGAYPTVVCDRGATKPASPF
jgi:HTH-type transcriptional regulator/antitoxin HigA